MTEDREIAGSDADERLGIQSVEVAASILSAMTETGAALALKDVVRLTGMSPGKVHRYLVSLVRSGLAVQEGTGLYAIGPQAIALGLAGLRSLAPVKIAPVFLQRLRDETGETSICALWSARGPVVVDLEESSRPIFMNIRAGSLLPVATTATGLVFGAHLPEDTLINVDGEMRTLRDELGRKGRKLVKEVREQGFALVHGSLVPGISAMAAPVFDHRGRIAAVIAFLSREEDATGPSATRKADILKQTAAAFSARLGGPSAGSGSM